MITNTKILLISCTCFALLFSSAQSQAQEVEPGLSLFTFTGERNISLSPEGPLMLFVSIENAAAQRVTRRNQTNQRLLNDFKKTGEYQDFSAEEKSLLAKDYPVLEVPKITLGSNSMSLASLISVHVRDSAGAKVELTSKSLASNNNKATAIELPENQTLLYRFAVTADQLQNLALGTYHFAAAIDTSTQNHMWQGVAYSNPITINLKKANQNWQGSNQRAMLVSAFLVHDHQFTKAESHAREWVEKHPESVDAWAQLGEALHGQNKNTEALEAMNSALDKFWLKTGGTPSEAPVELLDSIQKVENALNQRHKF